jgi:hypothetical protein
LGCSTGLLRSCWTSIMRVGSKRSKICFCRYCGSLHVSCMIARIQCLFVSTEQTEAFLQSLTEIYTYVSVVTTLSSRPCCTVTVQSLRKRVSSYADRVQHLSDQQSQRTIWCLNILVQYHCKFAEMLECSFTRIALMTAFPIAT